MKKYRYLFFAALLLLLCACGKTEESSVSDNEITTEQENENTAADSSADAQADVSGNEIADSTDTGNSAEGDDPNKTIITVQRVSSPASQVISSASSENTFDNNDFDDDESTGLGTPHTFEVDDAMITADGTYNTKLSGELLTAINKAREGAGLDVLETNASLSKVADVRAKEITYSLGHLRADGSYWSTVAPLYYEAECIAQGFTTAADTSNAWLSEGSTREYLLSEDLNSIGLSCFEYAGTKYMVASFGR
ncbi:MAG: CAP domain-containing protein [Lachnospiraceae bacterium]